MFAIGNELLKLVLIDSLILLIAIIISSIYISKKSIGKEKIALYIYMIVTFSIYNIYVKPVQDYLLPIPRTYIFYQKIVAGLSIYDFFSIGLCGMLLIRYFILKRDKGIFKQSNVIMWIWRRDVYILVLSFGGFYLYMLTGNPSDYMIQLRTLRGVITGFICVYITMLILKKYDKEQDIRRLLSILFFLNFMNVLSQVISSFFLQSISWQRGGHSVVLLDQSESYMSLFLLPLIIAKNKIISKWMVFTAYVIILLQVYNYVKMLYLNAALLLILLVIIGLMGGRISRRIRNLSMLIGIAVFIFTLFFINSSKGDKMSRVGQNNSLMVAFQNNPVNIIFGIGDGGLIIRQTMSEDGGERRVIDSENEKYSQYQAEYQVPYLGTLKTSGILGMVFIVYYLVLLLKLTCRVQQKYGWYYCAALGLFLIVVSVGRLMIIAEPQIPIFLCEAYIIYALLLRVELLRLPNAVA